MDDRQAMERALALAASVEHAVNPNPPVGCVLLRDGEVVGEGATEPPPGRHAEAVALERAGALARGATAVVTLEPCDHHGRTPPCSRALRAAGVARVVYSVDDPNPTAAGGAAALAAAGVTVQRLGDGEVAARAARQVEAHRHHARTGRPLVTVKLAASLDGRVAAADGSSQWITGPSTRARVHRLRAAADAVIVGSGTALADDPRLTVRLPDWRGEQPLRVVLDRRLRLPPDAALTDGAAPTLVLTAPDAAPQRRHALQARGVAVVAVPPAVGEVGLDLAAALGVLGDRDVRRALVEGGPQLAGALAAAGLVDRLLLHLGPVTLGPQGSPVLAGASPPTLAAAPRWRLEDLERVDDDLLAAYVPQSVPHTEGADAPPDQTSHHDRVATRAARPAEAPSDPAAPVHAQAATVPSQEAR